MAPPTIRGNDPPGTVYRARQGRTPLPGDLMLMFLPIPAPVPPGWTRLGPDVVYRTAVGDEHTFPGPALWYGPDVDEHGLPTGPPAGCT